VTLIGAERRELRVIEEALREEDPMRSVPLGELAAADRPGRCVRTMTWIYVVVSVVVLVFGLIVDEPGVDYREGNADAGSGRLPVRHQGRSSSAMTATRARALSVRSAPFLPNAGECPPTLPGLRHAPTAWRRFDETGTSRPRGVDRLTPDSLSTTSESVMLGARDGLAGRAFIRTSSRNSFEP
jgi:hypothetical protein